MALRLAREIRVVHGYRRAFVRAGEGPPLLLLHGSDGATTVLPVGDHRALTATVTPA